MQHILRISGRAVFVRNGSIVLATGSQETGRFELAGIAAANRQPFALENVIAAVAAGWALGIGNDLLQAGIETFEYEMV